MSLTLLFVIAMIAGVVGAMTGLGAGVILVPALTCAGVDIKHAIALNVISAISVSSGAAWTYVRDRFSNLRINAFSESFAVLGAFVGASTTVLSARRPLFFFCAAALVICGAVSWRRRHQSWAPVLHPDRVSRWLTLEGSYYDPLERKTITYGARWAFLAGPLLFGTGLVAGLLGVGSGAFAVLVHDFMGLPPKVSRATSTLIIGVMALAGASVYLEAGFLDSQLVTPVILGVLLGAFLGAKLFVQLTNQFVMRVFLIVLAALGFQMFLHGIRGG